MKIAGSNTLPEAAEQLYQLLRDPVVLARCMPGCQSLELTAPGEYEMHMKMVISSVQGLFQGKVRISDEAPPTGFRLAVEGSGKVGFMNGSGLLTLTPRDSGTEIGYDGEVRVGGVIAGVGQRLIQTTARFLIKRFFEALAREASWNREAPAAD